MLVFMSCSSFFIYYNRPAKIFMQHQINIAVMFINVIMFRYSLVWFRFFFPLSLRSFHHYFRMLSGRSLAMCTVHILHILNIINMRRNVSLISQWTKKYINKIDRIHLQRWMQMNTWPVPFSPFSIRYFS